MPIPPFSLILGENGSLEASDGNQTMESKLVSEVEMKTGETSPEDWGEEDWWTPGTAGRPCPG